MRLARFAPIGLAILAEGAWTWVVGSFMQELVLRSPALGLPQFVAAAAVGVVATRMVARRFPRPWPWIGLGVMVAAAAVGVLASDEARAALAVGRFGADGALGMNPGGLLLGLAVLRGFGQAHLPLGDDRLGRLLVGGIALLVLVALLGSVVTEPFRSRFEADALAGSVLFAASALLALALTRLTVMGAGTGADWPRNPVWVGLVVTIVLLVELLAVASSGVIGPALELVVGIAIGPLVVIGLLFGWTRTTIQAFIAIVFLVGLIYGASQLQQGGGPASQPAAGGGSGGPSTVTATPSEPIQLLGFGLAIIVGAIVVLLLIRAWMRRAADDVETIDETRSIDRGLDERIPRPFRLPFHRSPAPTSAAEAYRALIATLGDRPVVAREPGETPHEHAKRLRGQGWGRLGLELLAADYALERFAGLSLTGTEHRRAIRRWRRLATELRPLAAPSPEEVRPPPPDLLTRRLQIDGHDLPPAAGSGGDPDR